MTSRYATPAPLPPRHPAFVHVTDYTEADATWLAQHQTMASLMHRALVDAFQATPWEHAVVLRVRPPDFPEATHAVALLCGPTLALRVYVTTGKLEKAEFRVMRGQGARCKMATPPWGEPPATPPAHDADMAALVAETEGR